MNKKVLIPVIIVALLIIAIITGAFIIINGQSKNTPEEVLSTFVEYINQGNYEEMYNLISEEAKTKISKEDFITRNENIYEGIDMKNMKLEIKSVEEESNTISNILYGIKMDTSCGEIEFSYTVKLTKNDEKEYKINWVSNMIFPDLNDDDKIKVKQTQATRGSIVDRNGNLLAGEGKVSAVGFVPGKMGENKEEDIKAVALLLDVSEESITNELNKSYVKDDTFVQIKKIAYDNQELKTSLLQIPGIKISTSNDRVYPLGEAAAHLTGYIHSITAEELEENADKGYNANSKIGTTGLEKQYEDRLKGTNGIEIYIENSNGEKTKTIAKKEVQDGENIKLTIDANLQKQVYEQTKDNKGFFVIMNPETGEILSLVSTPSYNPNDFILGMSNTKWNSIQNDEAKPMYNRYLQTWIPGSTFKPITGAIGLTSGKLSETDEFYYEGLSWQKDSSWGSYEVTTLTPYNGNKNLRNAIVYSDNIYFAQAALQIGRDTFTEGLDKLGFNEDIGFTLSTAKSQYANDKIDSEIQLADSGYGQGEILVNPIHMASIYSAFLNDGNMIKPYLEYKENAQTEYLKENVFTKEAANTMKEYLLEVVERPDGTGHKLQMDNVRLAGKTGTAELKQSKDDTERKTLGWFNCFTVDSSNPMLIISMVEDGNINGGSRYLIQKIRTLF